MAWPSRRSSACVDEEALAAFADGKLADREQRPVEEHLADCGDCRAVLARAAGRGTSGEPSGPISDGPIDARGLPPGTRVGRYVIDRLVGQGAMGAVYEANDPDLDRKVAVKVLRAGDLSDAGRQRMRARLLREAQAMARLSHPEVITVHDVGAFEDQLFVAMEFVDGGTLRQWRAAVHRGHAEVLAVYERAGSGLAAAHDAGLVHRDFKPDNVLVGRDGRVRVTDFGLARGMDRGDAEGKPSDDATDSSDARRVALTLTHTGALLGTPAYMAPEQLAGRAADARSDVFGFCVSLYEALYAERPFAGSTVPVLMAAIEKGAVRAAPVMTPVPAWIRAVLLRGLRAAPDERHASMRALLDALRSSHATSRRRRRGLAAVAMGTIGVAAAVSIYARNPRESRPMTHGAPPSVSTAEPIGAAEAIVMAGPPASVDPPTVHAPPVPSPLAFTSTSRPAPSTSRPAREQAAGPSRGASGPPSPPLTMASVARSPIAPPEAKRSPPAVGNNGALILE